MGSRNKHTIQTTSFITVYNTQLKYMRKNTLLTLIYISRCSVYCNLRTLSGECGKKHFH